MHRHTKNVKGLSLDMMRKLDMQYGHKQQWKQMQTSDNTQQSIMIRSDKRKMDISPNAMKMNVSVPTHAYQSVFTRKDEQMWAKDYTAWTLMSDIIIGR